ncbi:MAG TPA: SDR family NAD(P)-dependent oxidoreductase [Polyangiaceae bacterium]
MTSRIAIVGIGVRVHGARDAEALLRRLAEAPAPVAPVPHERWDERALGPRPCARLLEEHDVDSRALRTPPATVAKLHRMERSVIAAMLAACDDARLTREAPECKRTSVHVGATTLGLDPANDHIARVRMPLVLRALEQAAKEAGLADDAAHAIASALEAAAPDVGVDSLMTTAAMAAGRVANALDLGGGHASYDAGMASSLAATIAGFESVRDGESDCAIVAGVSPLVTATQLLAHARRGLLASDARAWARASLREDSGTVLGEGALAIVLCREEAALARGVRVYAVVESHGTSGAGRRAKSRAAAECTAEAARAALASAGVAPRDVDLVECQAPGLPATDSAELAGLAEAYGDAVAEGRTASSARQFGFLGAASGMLSVAVAALAVARRTRAGVGGPVWRASVSSPGFGDVAHHLLLAHPDVAKRALESAPTLRRDVAMTGMGVLVPGADSPSALFHTVVEGACHVREMPASRFRLSDHAAPQSRDAEAVALAGTVAEPERDARRLQLPPVTLAKLDGAVVLATLACEQALDDAAFEPGALARRRTGVWVGHLPLRAAEMEAERAMLAVRCVSTALRVLAERGTPASRAEALAQAFERSLSCSAASIDEETLRAGSSIECAARLASLHDLRGGVLSVDAACASSLVAIHLARRALLRREVDVAVVCGVAWNLFPEYYAALATLGALSFRGSRPFEAGADGMVPGEGAAAIVLEREGEHEGSRVRARILGSALASDGRGAAILAPNTAGQERALRRAYECSGADPSTVDLVEAHGTGTATGDAVEVETYRRVFAHRPADRPLWVGSVKSNIGHLSSGAGLAGVVKAALALEHRMLLPTRHAGVEHALPELEGGPLALPHAAAPWPARPGGAPRRAGVSSFGLGGIDAHVVLEEASLASEPRRAASAVDPAATATDVATRLIPELVEIRLPERDVEALLRARPPGSTVVIVPDDGGVVARALAGRLESVGLTPVMLGLDAGASFETVESAVRELASGTRPLAGIIDVHLLRAHGERSDVSRLAREATRAAERTLGLVRALGSLAQEGGGPHAAPFLVVATSGGGGLGLASAPATADDGAVAALLRSARLELDGFVCRAVDLDATEDPFWVAETLLAEAASGGDRVEVGYVNRRRVTTTLRAAPRGAEFATLRALRGAVLFSGGSRGVVFACARRLAAMGVPAIVTGRTRLPLGDEPWAHASDDALAEMRRDAIASARERGETPKEAARRVDQWIERRALARALREAESANLPLEYHACDVTDGAALAALAEEMVRRHGAIAGVVHGAMLEESRALAAKRVEAVTATLAVKLNGLANLLDLTRSHHVRFVVAFGSVAGRLGNVGQADYAAANAAMARLLAAFAAEHPEIRCATLEWSAWSDIGAAADPATAALLARAGVVPMSPAEGSRFFVEELARGLPDRFVVVGEERSLLSWPAGVRATDASGERPRAVDDRGVPIDAGALPMVDSVSASGVVTRSIGLGSDPFLADHHFEGGAVLPGAFALELLLESVSVTNPDFRVTEARDFRLDAPLRIAGERSVLVRTTAVPATARGDVLELIVEARVVLTHRGSFLDRDRPFCSARVIAVRSGAKPENGLSPASVELPDAPATARRGSIFEHSDLPVGLGPRFHHVAWVECRGNTVRGAIAPPLGSAMHARTRAPQWLADPLVLDAAFQIASHWDALRPGGAVAVPVALRRVVLCARRPDTSGAVVEALVTDDDGRDIHFDVRLTAPEGALLAELHGLVLRRVAPAVRDIAPALAVVRV